MCVGLISNVIGEGEKILKRCRKFHNSIVLFAKDWCVCVCIVVKKIGIVNAVDSFSYSHQDYYYTLDLY